MPCCPNCGHTWTAAKATRSNSALAPLSEAERESMTDAQIFDWYTKMSPRLDAQEMAERPNLPDDLRDAFQRLADRAGTTRAQYNKVHAQYREWRFRQTFRAPDERLYWHRAPFRALVDRLEQHHTGRRRDAWSKSAAWEVIGSIGLDPARLPE